MFHTWAWSWKRSIWDYLYTVVSFIIVAIAIAMRLFCSLLTTGRWRARETWARGATAATTRAGGRGANYGGWLGSWGKDKCLISNVSTQTVYMDFLLWTWLRLRFISVASAGVLTQCVWVSISLMPASSLKPIVCLSVCSVTILARMYHQMFCSGDKPFSWHATSPLSAVLCRPW